MFRLVLATLIVIFVAHRGYYNRKYPADEAATTTRMSSSRGTQVAAILSLLALLSTAAFILAPKAVSWAALPLPDWLRWAGLGVAAAGFGLLEWAHRALASNWSDQPRLMVHQQLVVDGPYRYIRHPMYTAFLMILGSTLLISSNALVGGSWLLGVGLDAWARIRFEERAMRQQFGRAFDSYAASTGALLPRLAPSGSASDSD